TPATGPLDADTILDISHESLIRQWGKLERWANDEAKSAETYRLLEKTALEWSEPWTGTNLDRVLEWKRAEQPSPAWAARYGGDFDRAMEFIDLGLEQRRQRDEARDAALLRAQQLKEVALYREARIRMYKALAALALVGLIFAGLLSAYALYQRATALANA